MKYILLDTCVLIHIIRESEIGKKCLEALVNIDINIRIVVSVVSIAELNSFSKQNKWGKSKIDKINAIFEKVICIDINNSDKQLIDSYCLIDAFSKKKNEDKNGVILIGSARKMGKNDLWIAATSLTLNIPLMTTDTDFDHLNQSFINVYHIKI